MNAPLPIPPRTLVSSLGLFEEALNAFESTCRDPLSDEEDRTFARAAVMLAFSRALRLPPLLGVDRA